MGEPIEVLDKNLDADEQGESSGRRRMTGHMRGAGSDFGDLAATPTLAPRFHPVGHPSRLWEPR